MPKRLPAVLVLCGICALVLFSLKFSESQAAPTEAAIAKSHPEADWAVPVDQSFNLYQMTPGLYRSALPGQDDLALLEKLQVQTVISFIKDDDANWLGNAGIVAVSIPLHADRVRDSDVLHVLNVVQQAAARGPVLMHCKHGSDRTGIMAAMYRSVVQGWSKQDALNEMQHGGYGTGKDVEDATRYVEGADIGKLRQAFVSGTCSTTWLSTCYLRNWLANL